MHKILLFANGPLLESQSSLKNAYTIRSQMYLDFLQNYPCTLKKIILTPEKSKLKSLSQVETDLQGKKLLKFMQKQIDLFQPDIIIAVNNLTSYLTSQLRFDAYFVADLNGWLLAEAQVQSLSSGSNLFLAEFIKRERTILQRADKILCCSENQKKASYGELALIGKLNAENFQHKLLGKIMNFITPAKIIKHYDLKLPKNALVLGWLSGFNNWADEKLLLDILLPSLKNNPKLVFVCTGGAYPDLPNSKYEHVYQSLKKAGLINQCRFLNWIPKKYLQSVISQFDLAINTDLDCVESHFGARNRISELLANCVPVLSTDYSEVAQQLNLFGLGIGFEHGEEAKIKKFLEKLTLKDLKLYCKNLKDFNRSQSLKNYMQDLQSFLDEPFRVINTNLNPSKLQLARGYYKQHGLRKLLHKIISKI